MGTSNISSIGKVFLQNQTADVTGVQGDEAKVAFEEIMGQMSNVLGNSLGSANRFADSGKQFSVTEPAAGKDYDRYQSREMAIKQSSSKNWKEDDAVSEKLESFAEDVKDVLKEELGVSDEQIEEAMTALGIAFTDLLNPSQLAALVTELTGAEDMSALLCNSEFMTVMQSVGQLGEELLADLGVTTEEFGQMLEQLQQQDIPDDLTEETSVKTDEKPVENPVAADVSAEEAADVSAEDTTVETAEQDVKTGDAAQSAEQDAQGTKTIVDDTRALEDTADEIRTDIRPAEEDVQADGESEDSLLKQEDLTVKTEDAPAKENASSGGKNQNANTHTSTGETVVVNQNVSEHASVQSTEGTMEFSRQLDVSNIIRQIAEFSKVTLSTNATTLEMQLNPANLGKIFLEITAKDGAVSAHITAQNEIVKEALESQLVELRQNMNQAGVKVDAVEVTVGSHEFERNLEQNAKREEQRGEEQEKAANHTRRINLNDMDELAGIMSEEESLVAQMMAEQGNSIDFTA